MRTTVFAAALVALSAAPQPPAKKDDGKDPQAKYEPRSAPGAGQKFLEPFAGEWAVEKTFFPRQGEPARATGTCRQEMIHGGRFLRSEFTFDGPAGKTTGTGTIGFEPASGLFTSTWVDSRSTRTSVRRSKDPFDGKEVVLYARPLDGGGGEAAGSRTVTRLEAGGNKIVHRQYAAGAGGADRLVMELVLTRRHAE